jgi:hypothetical protein
VNLLSSLLRRSHRSFSVVNLGSPLDCLAETPMPLESLFKILPPFAVLMVCALMGLVSMLTPRQRKMTALVRSRDQNIGRNDDVHALHVEITELKSLVHTQIMMQPSEPTISHRAGSPGQAIRS